jgi:hypothetical protein
MKNPIGHVKTHRATSLSRAKMSNSIEVTSAPLTSIRIRIRIGTNRPVNNPVNLPRAKQIQKVVLISEHNTICVGPLYTNKYK